MPRCKFCEFEETDARVMHWHLRMMHGRNLHSASQYVRWMFPRPKAKPTAPAKQPGGRNKRAAKLLTAKRRTK